VAIEGCRDFAWRRDRRADRVCSLYRSQQVFWWSPPTGSELVPGRFVDVTKQTGIQFLHQAAHTSRKYLIETMGSGVAVFDCDNDGRLDIFFANGAPYSDPTPPGFIPRKTGPEYWDRLFHQKPDGTFEDITEKSGLKGVGYDMGVAVGDYDNDGYEDIYVTGYGGNHLYHNNGDCTFTDVTDKAGVGAMAGPHRRPGLILIMTVCWIWLWLVM